MQSPAENNFTTNSPWFRATEDGVQCLLCPHHCHLRDGKTGICRTHVAKNHELFTTAYGNPCAVHVDPVEKKPLFHFLPGTDCLSIATAGCNLSCRNCQNWEISQRSPSEITASELFPQQVVDTAIKNECLSIAYTYTEPTVFYEYMLATAVIAKAAGIRNLMVSNGYINEDPLRALAKNLDAANIDLKSFSGETYKKFFGGNLQPVLDTLQILKEEGVWLEITHLLIPGITDKPGQLTAMCDWLASHGFADTPLHFSRFYPMFRMTETQATPLPAIEKARKIAQDAGIRYVYIGNVPGNDAQHTYCPACKKPVIERNGFGVTGNHLIGGKCAWCGGSVAGEWT